MSPELALLSPGLGGGPLREPPSPPIHCHRMTPSPASLAPAIPKTPPAAPIPALAGSTRMPTPHHLSTQMLLGPKQEAMWTPEVPLPPSPGSTGSWLGDSTLLCGPSDRLESLQIPIPPQRVLESTSARYCLSENGRSEGTSVTTGSSIGVAEN